MTFMNATPVPTFACSRVQALPYAFSCHSALREILAAALRKACSLGVLDLPQAQALYAASAAASSGSVRAALEEVLTACEAGAVAP